MFNIKGIFSKDKYLTVFGVLVLALTLALVIFIKSLFSGISAMYFDNSVKFSTGHIKIVQAEYPEKEKLFSLNKPVSNYAAVISRFNNIPEIRTISPRIRFSVVLSANSKDFKAVGIGADPFLENSLLNIKKCVTAGKYFSGRKNEVILGNLLAEELGIKVGDSIVVVPQTAFGSINAVLYQVVGTFDLGNRFINKTTFYIPLESAQTLLDLEGKVTEIILLLTDQGKSPLIAAEVEKNIADVTLAALPWQKQGRLTADLKIINYLADFICLIMILLAGFILAVAFLFSLLGKNSEKDAKTLIIEGACIGLVGGLAGLVLGTTLALFAKKSGVDLGFLQYTSLPLNPRVYPIFKISVGVFTWLVAVLLGGLAVMPAAFTASNLKINKN